MEESREEFKYWNYNIDHLLVKSSSIGTILLDHFGCGNLNCYLRIKFTI